VSQVFEVHGWQGLGPVIQDFRIVEKFLDDAQLTEADRDLFEAWGEELAISVLEPVRGPPVP
jgi:hypothetical protein